jgi:hypothetical protein
LRRSASHAPPSPNAIAEYNRHPLIVGGGISGMTSAIEASKAGYSATIVEKSDKLGGWLGNFAKRAPSRAPYADPQDTGIAEMTAGIMAEARITVYLNSTVARTSGASVASPRTLPPSSARPSPKTLAPSSRPLVSPATTSTSCLNSAGARAPTWSAGRS